MISLLIIWINIFFHKIIILNYELYYCEIYFRNCMIKQTLGEKDYDTT